MNIIFKLILLLLIAGMGTVTYSILVAETTETDTSGNRQASDNDEDDEITSRVTPVDGQVAIRLDTALQRQSGIKTQAIKPMKIYKEVDAFGRVVNIKDLLELRSSINQIRGEINIVSSELSAANKSLDRLRVLHKEAANISTRQVQDAEADASILKAKLNTLTSKLKDERTQVEQTWGTVLSSWVIDNQTVAFDQILSGHQILLRVSLRATDTLPDDIKFVFVGRNGNRRLAQKAEYISPAIESDNLLQGETYYFMVASNEEKYRAGMQVHVWVPQSVDTLSGVFIPDTAIVWSGGNPWVYIKQDEELFLRRAINDPVELGDGVFVKKENNEEIKGGFNAGDEVVSTGAQMLLAEEYKGSIPDEDDNP